MARRVLHQVTASMTVGDAITDQVLLLARWLSELGFVSHIFAERIDPQLRSRVQPLPRYRPRRGEEWLVYHHSVGSQIVEWLRDMPQRLIVVYHNVTPPAFFRTLDPGVAQKMAPGREQLAALRPRTALALADSAINEQELVAAGFADTGVLPIALDPRRYDLPRSTGAAPRARGSGAPSLLFVGRVAPNKKQDDLIRLLYWYRRIAPTARLALVGSDWLPSYGRALREWARVLGVSGGVHFAGRVSQRDLVTHYQQADVYVSMSEHEGFGKPLVESMYLGLPVLAYAAGAVPETMGGAGVLFHHKDFEALAEMVDLLVRDSALRERIIARQRARAQLFVEAEVRERCRAYLSALGLG